MGEAKRPPDGLTVRVDFVRARDGDTIEVTGGITELLWAIRPTDCWCYETDDSDESIRAIALEAKRETEALCKLAGSELRVQVEWNSELITKIREQGKHINLLKGVTFDRIPAIIWLDKKTTLNQKLVEMGLASTTKEGPLGE